MTGNIIKKDIIIVGAGPAGIGSAIAVQEAGEMNYEIIEMGEVGNSFVNWPKETRLLTPSFTSNMFMQPDLNSVSPLTSPAFSMNTEHPSGEEYAAYLKHMADHFKLNIKENTKVISVEKSDEIFYIKTVNTKNKDSENIKNKGENEDENITDDKKENENFNTITTYECKYIIWAAGEFFYPKKNIFPGSELCLKYSDIRSFEELINVEYKNKININKIENKIIEESNDRVIIIGGYEAGMDSAYNMARNGIKTLVLDKYDRLNMNVDDPSKSLSPYTVDRCIDFVNDNTILYEKDSDVKEIKFENNTYTITLTNEIIFTTKLKPIICAGFAGSAEMINNLINKKEGGDLNINEYDESNVTKNLFFSGPNIHSNNVILCFIYKFRMRFAKVVGEIYKRENKIDTDKYKEFIEYYKKYNFYLENTKECDINCSC